MLKTTVHFQCQDFVAVQANVKMALHAKTLCVYQIVIWTKNVQ